MTDPLQTFSKRWIKRIVDAVHWVEQQRTALARRRGRGRGRILPTQRYCQLTAKLEPTSSDTAATATAYRLKWDTSTGTWVDAEEDDFTIQVRDHDAWGVTGERGMVQARQTDDGVIWETVTQFGSDVYTAKLDGVLNAGASAVASIWTGNTLADSTDNFTVYAPKLLLTGSLASGEWVHVRWFRSERKFKVTGAEC